MTLFQFSLKDHRIHSHCFISSSDLTKWPDWTLDEFLKWAKDTNDFDEDDKTLLENIKWKVLILPILVIHFSNPAIVVVVL